MVGEREKHKREDEAVASQSSGAQLQINLGQLLIHTTGRVSSQTDIIRDTSTVVSVQGKTQPNTSSSSPVCVVLSAQGWFVCEAAEKRRQRCLMTNVDLGRCQTERGHISQHTHRHLSALLGVRQINRSQRALVDWANDPLRGHLRADILASL